MSEATSKTVDCVQSMRQARARLSAEIADMSYEELLKWLRGHRYEDSLLRRGVRRERLSTADFVPADCVRVFPSAISPAGS